MVLAQDTVEEVRSFNHPVTVCIVLVLAIRLYLWHGNFDEADQCANRMIETANQNSLIPYQAMVQATNGELLVRRGQPAAGIVHLREAVDTLHTVRYELHTSSLMTAFAEGLAMTGEHTAALEVIDGTIEAIKYRGDLFILPELLRIKGAMLARKHSLPEAEKFLRCALDLAAQQRASAWQLRAATSLAQFQSVHGRPEEAKAVLAPICDRFAEGADNSELMMARSLLRELG